MSKEDFVRLFETPISAGSSRQATFLERTTMVLLASATATSIGGVVFTLVQGQAILSPVV